MTISNLIQKNPCSYVVVYKDEYYVWYKLNNAGLAQLIKADGSKFSGTPNPDKLTVVKQLLHYEFNGSLYFKTKVGVFSATTGKKINHPKIIELCDLPSPMEMAYDSSHDIGIESDLIDSDRAEGCDI